MDRKQHGKLVTSSLVASERYKVYIPNALPPKPAINMAEIAKRLEKANFAIGELNGVVETVPDPLIINYMYVRKEAVLSSQIEGTQSTLDDLLRYESSGAAGVPVDDVTEVSSYVAAIHHGLKRVQGGFPLSNRIIREVHKILLMNSRGRNKTPGEFRRSQNWIVCEGPITRPLGRVMGPETNTLPKQQTSPSRARFLIGGTRPGNANFVPPPPDMVRDLMGDLEQFMHAKDRIPALVKAALIHQQFETIHPFLDGNGRAGRLLITLFLCVQGFLRSPFLYLSLFFKQHRSLYYEKLSEPRRTGNWENWINFFLEGVALTASDAKKTLMSIRKLFAADDKRIAGMGRARVSAELVFAVFKQKPLLTIAELTARTKLSKPTAISMVNRLIDMGILKKACEKKWGQMYAYSGYLKLLED